MNVTPMKKTKVELQNMCSANSSCKAIDYNVEKKFGHLCSSDSSSSISFYEICARSGIIVDE